jgi:chemotaxis protein MotB
MSKDPLSKSESYLSLEELLAQSSPRNSQNWLLTYLDVFVLIVMLVIMLITLSDINTQQQKQEVTTKFKTPPTCPAAQAPNVTNCPPAIVTENKQAQQSIFVEHKNEDKPGNGNLGTEPKVSNNTVVELTKIPEKIIAADNTTPKVLATGNPSADESKLQQRLTKTIDEFGLNKTVNIKVTHGYAQLEIQDKVLFKSSESKLTSSGEALIKRLTPLLKQAEGMILIEGHTDNIPIKTAQFPSNWELGASRATSVLHFLVSQNLDSSHLRAITYADTMPIADNSTPEGREKNRRVNILIKFPEP